MHNVIFRPWKKSRKSHASNLKKEAKIIIRKRFHGLWTILYVPLVHTSKRLNIYFDNVVIEPRMRTSSNLLVVEDVILLWDERVDLNTSFYNLCVPRNIHSSMRFIFLIKLDHLKDEIKDEFIIPDSACSWSFP